MKTFQKSITNATRNEDLIIEFVPDVILLFISPDFEGPQSFLSDLSLKFPDSLITGCSASGEIIDVNVDDNSIALNALKFESTECKLVYKRRSEVKSEEELGIQIIKDLSAEDLKHVLVFSDGLSINGDKLVKGLTSNIDVGIGITGGLAADGTDFCKTFVIRENKIVEGEVVALGFYGDALTVGYSANGGWDSFGIERHVTKSIDNVLYEIDGKPALELYKSYLGDKAIDLPGSGLLFPLSMRSDAESKPLVRTLLSVNEKDQSITFAGNIPEGSYVRLMKANVDRLINGAEISARAIKNSLDEIPDFALLISCVGRRLVLKQLVEEELEAVREVIGGAPMISGFYSYAELAPFGQNLNCLLHNQTMTITTFSETKN